MDGDCLHIFNLEDEEARDVDLWDGSIYHLHQHQAGRN